MSLEPPVHVNEQVKVEIAGCTHRGEGVGRVGGLAVFVPHTAPGDQVSCIITEVRKNFARARLKEVIHPARGRTSPACKIFDGCGGCHLQHLEYQRQLEIKTEQVRDALNRLGKLDDYTLHPIMGMKQPWHYRNKVYLHAGFVEGRLSLGYYEENSNRLVRVPDCALLPEDMICIWRAVEEKLRDAGITPYDVTTRKGLLRGVVIRKGFATGEAMVVFVVCRREFSGAAMAGELLSEFPSLVSVVQNINPPRSSNPLGEENVLLAGKEFIQERVGHFLFRISATSFFQVNPVQAEALYRQTVSFAGLTGRETVLDVYCGTGAIALFLAKKARRVYGIENIASAVADARENAILNGVDNVEFIAGAAEQVLPRLYQEGIRPEVVLLDPPRQGCEQAALDAVAGMKPERIVYVSCNPATLARDLRFLAERGFRTTEVQPVDMFPHTSHVECVVLMCRSGK
ncbi:hypothetical protein SY88_17825 [Clostridiales bacterium PH28_bin88]|nr:hypothetical protein SY88_17825 [Clostridiales bacterium PH28_bin88]